MKTRKDIIVVDLDGTLCDCAHRQDYARAGQWEEFHGRLVHDRPHEDVAYFLKELSFYHKVIAVTGRNEAFRQLTWDWLKKHKLDENIDEILMRPDGDWSPDHELKTQMLEKALGNKSTVLERVAIVLEDRDKVIEAYRNYGLPCWQVRPGSF